MDKLAEFVTNSFVDTDVNGTNFVLNRSTPKIESTTLESPIRLGKFGQKLRKTNSRNPSTSPPRLGPQTFTSGISNSVRVDGNSIKGKLIIIMWTQISLKMG